MEATLKTKDVSEMLGVNPTTIQRWAKYFSLNCATNEYGHYLFSTKHVEAMKHVQRQLQEGKKMKEVDLTLYQEIVSASKIESPRMVNSAMYEEKLTQVMTQVQDLEQRISRKADEVVSYQLLKHRSELEEMRKVIQDLEGRLLTMETKIQEPMLEEELPMAAGNASRKKWRSFMQIFSL